MFSLLRIFYVVLHICFPYTLFAHSRMLSKKPQNECEALLFVCVCFYE